MDGEAERVVTPRDEKLLGALGAVIRWAMRALAVVLAALVVWGVVDVGFVLVAKVRNPPFLYLEVADVIGTFGSVLAVLIALELYDNVALFLREERVALDLVLGTALAAVARKLIVIDWKNATGGTLSGLAATVLVLSISIVMLKRR